MNRLSAEDYLWNGQTLRALINGTTDAIYVKDLCGRYTLFNAVASQVTGRAVQDVLGKDDTFLFSADEAKAVMEADRRVMTEGVTKTFEETITTAHGEVRHYLSTKGPLFSEKGEMIGLFGITRDITERKWMEASLKKVNERLVMAQESARAGVWDWDILTGKVEWSPQMYELFGLDPRKVSPTFSAWKAALHPDDAAQADLRIEEALKNKQMLSSEYRVVFSSGQIRWIYATGHGYYDDKGLPIRMLGICQDITQKKIAEEKLRENEALLTNIIDSTPSSIFAFDCSHRFVLINQAMADFYEMPKDQVLGKTLHDVFPREVADRLYAANQKIIENGESLLIEEDVPNKRMGIVRTMMTVKFPLKDARGKVIGLGGVATDITERKRLESKLLEAKEVAEAASRSRATFLDIAAHELRTPVTAISLLLQAVRRRIEKGHAVDISVLTRLYEPVDRLARLVVDLLDISRLERGLIDLQWSPTDVVALASNCFSEFQLQAPLRQMSFKGPSEAVRVELDPVRINQVLSNLLDNAIRYTPGDTPIELYLEQRPDSVRFSVVDHGPGIPREQLGSLFQAFSRGKSEATIRSSGLGLGLSVCRGIVELHGGTIGVSSEVGQGSTFYFDLPIRRASV